MAGREHGDLYRLSQADEHLQTLNQQARRVTSLPQLSAAEKRQRLDELQLRMLNTARRALGRPALEAVRP